MDLALLGSGLAIGLAGIGVAIGQGYLAFKAMEVIGKNPMGNNFYLSTTILGIALVESAAIYGLIIAFQILTSTTIEPLAGIGIGLSVGLAGLGVGIGEGRMVAGALDAMNKDPDNRNKIITFMVLFLALIESAAIYGLVISFQMLSLDFASGYTAIGAGLAIGLAGLGVGIGEGILAEKALGVIADKPRLSGYYLTITILGIALVESAAIYGMIISFQILGTQFADPLAAVGIGLSVGLAGLGVGIGEGIMIGGAIEAMGINNDYRKKIMTFMILFLALVESAAIYGLIVSFQMLSMPSLDGLFAIGAGCAIGFAGLGVGIGEGIFSKKSMETIGKRPQMSNFVLTTTILGIALVESAAIYGLVIAFQILGSDTITGLAAIGAGLSIGLSALGAGVGEGFLAAGTMSSIYRNPTMKSKSIAFMVLFIALIEVIAIYGLIVAFQILA